MIPKIIHYCWFGGSELPDVYKKYIEEWHKLHTDWKIIEWNEKSFFDESEYFLNTLQNKNWANASNYARLKILYEHGGIYLDTDMKLIKPLNYFLNNKCFLGFEEGDYNHKGFWVNNAIIGASVNHTFIKKCLEQILTQFDGFEEADQSSPKLVTKVLIEQYNLAHYGRQELNDGVSLFEKEVFYPIPWNLAKQTINYKKYVVSETYAVHMWGRTWFSKEKMLGMIDDLQMWNKDQETYITQLTKEVQSYKEEVLQISHLESVINSLQEKQSHLLAELLIKDNHEKTVETLKKELSIKSQTINDNEKEIKILKEELSIKSQIIEGLEQKNNNLEKVIDWYKKTYESRSLLGIIKQKVFTPKL